MTMANFSYGQTRYNNLLKQFNNPNVSQEELDAFNIGQSLGNFGQTMMGKKNDGVVGDSIVGGVGDTDAANMDAINNLASNPIDTDITGDLGKLGKKNLDMDELLELSKKGGLYQ